MTEAPQQQHATNPQPLSRFLTVLSQNRALSFGGGSALLLLGLFIGLAYNFSQSLVFWVPFLVAGVLLFICGFGKKLPASVPLSSDPPRTSPQFPELDFPPSTKDLQQIYKDLGYLEIVLAPVEKQPEDGVPMFPQGIIGEGDLTDPRAIGAFLMGEQHGIIKRLWHTCKNYDDCVSQGRKNEAHGLRISLGVPADALPDPQTDRDFFCNELHESIMDTAAELIADRYQRLAQTESLGESSALAGAGSALAGSATQVRNDLDAHLMWDIWVHENVGKKWQKVFYWTTVRTMEPPMVATHSIQSLERFTSESNWESMAEWHSVQEDDSGGQGGGGEERQTRLPSLRAVQKDRYNPYEVDSQAAVILPWNRTADVVMGPAECGPKALDVIAPPPPWPAGGGWMI